MRLIRKGAEADLYLHNWHGLQAIVKRRVRKKYRHRSLDLRIRRYRTIHEAQMIHEARKAGVPTPTVYEVDRDRFTIVMEYIQGDRVKELLESMDDEEVRSLSLRIGRLIAKLHTRNIIHGDLTTSNLIEAKPAGRYLDTARRGMLFLIDFGLSYFSSELEDRGVDLHLLKRALNSTHFRVAGECYSQVVSGYSEVLGEDYASKVLEKVEEIGRRGRYALRPSP
ncbi:MAG: Kae1-associated kinase Bud32 [Candidatus Bathyarchaeia archaeon]|nr:Kae1-associated kinase Bud32 [Candidatus Bathyarchaeota archaeon]